MKKFISENKLIVVDYIILMFSLIVSIFDLKNSAIILLIIASLILIKIVKDIVENYISFSVLFTAFHVLYGLSGVISKCWFNQLSTTYGRYFVYSPYLIAYSLCTIALLTGIIIANNKYNDNKYNYNKKDIEEKTIKNFFLFIAYCGLGMTSVCEIINLIRVGGLNTLLAGKAIYQATVDELIFTIPTQYIFQVAVAALGIYIYIILKNKEKIAISKICICIILALPYIITIILLGRRGVILATILILTISIFQVKPLKKISLKLIAIVVVIYVSLGTLYAVRNDIKLLFKDFKEFCNTVSIQNIIRNLNPAMTEFGCTYGNFNRFYIMGGEPLLYGKSYLQGWIHIVPTYLYPGEKPRMITYEFRDKYFPAKAEISSIASTGFSSILETYWNFWYFGAIIYVGYGYLLIFLEKNLKNKNYFYMLFYVSTITITYSFHRSEFGHSISEIIIVAMEILVIYWFNKKIYNSNNKMFNFIRDKIK